MARTSSSEAERAAIKMVASLMAAGARTAPKTRGVDTTQTMIVEGEDIELLAAAMEEAANTQPEYLAPSFRRDARNVRSSECVVLIGVSGVPKKPEQPLDCGACGFKTCKGLLNARLQKGKDFSGPLCVFASLDLGIALGSAVKVAADLNIDNRIMYTLGATATKLRWLEADVVLGIPLSTTGKSPYFDRG
jgi:uncharacterized ferredoxin-like protein